MLSLLVGRAYAAITSTQLNSLAIPSLTGTTNGLIGVIATILTWVFLIAGILAVIYLIYGGILYITAGGDAEKATKGRVAIVNAIIGIIIIALAFLIVMFVNNAVQNASS
ncbi:MAG: hypothetical protein ABSE91_03700 [Patescibacteria group bacterium]|jgi:hypothetical protein